jgi:rsbT co-antagonist protein RsbR
LWRRDSSGVPEPRRNDRSTHVFRRDALLAHAERERRARARKACTARASALLASASTMSHRKYMQILKLDEAELRSRRAFFEISDDDLARLASLRPYAEKWTAEIVEAFYQLLLEHHDTKKFFDDDATVRRVKAAQREYFLGLFSGRCDLAYVEDRLRVGIAHERIGLAPKWYLGAYRRYLHLLHERLYGELDANAAAAAFASVQRIVFFDTALALDTYIAANAETLGRHQAAIRELSTPVIRVHEGVLLLPLVGAIDSHRAQQITESVLVRVAEEQAKCIIIDIAGVPVVDTKVADHLVKTTAAVKLLGAQTILTGISAQVARTIVQLGVDISTMHTLARLADGIELALSLVGKSICPQGASR